MHSLKRTKLVLISFVMLVVSISVAVANPAKDRLSEEAVSISNLGVTFNKPNQWIEQKSEILVENLKKLDQNEEEIKKLLITHRGSIPVASFSKYDPAGYQGIVPTINVLIRKNAADDFPSFFTFIESSKQDLLKVLNNLTFLTEATETTLSGKKVVYFIVEFDLSTAQGETYRIRSITYSIPFEKVFIQISMSEDASEKNRALFEAFINSFRVEDL